MKDSIHPKLNKVVFVDVSSNQEYVTMSTMTSEKTKKINGEDHYIIEVQVSSSSHPFYTGKHRVVDTENLVKKFEKKSEKAQSLSDKLKASKDKRLSRKTKVKELKEQKSLTLKDMLKSL